MTALLQTPLSPKQRLIRPSHHMRRTRSDRLIASGADIAFISPAHITHRKLRSPPARAASVARKPADPYLAVHEAGYRVA